MSEPLRLCLKGTMKIKEIMIEKLEQAAPLALIFP